MPVPSPAVLALPLAALALVATVAAGPAHADPRKNPRVQCGCPSPRLLGRGPVVLDANAAVPAWLHDEARLEPFLQDTVNKQKLSAIDAPVVVEEFAAFPDGKRVPTTSRLVRVHATGPIADGTFLGVLRKSDLSPRDVMAVSGPGTASPPPPGAPPSVQALWLAPLEQRERPGCGVWLTHRIAFELTEGSPVPEAFVVSDEGTGTVALVDARQAGAFGLGLIEVCEQGVPFAAGTETEIEVRPVSSSFGIGEPWRFHSDGTGTTDLGRTQSPKTADAGRIAEPFPVPGETDVRGPNAKEVAAAVMGAGVAGAALFALMTWVIIPARRRRVKDIRCPACGQDIPVDTLDTKTQGFFCPACGASGFVRKGKGQIEAQALPKA